MLNIWAWRDGAYHRRDIMPGPLSEARRAAWQEIFNDFDVDGSGRINAAELGDAIKKLSGGLPVSEDEVKAAMKAVDADGSGQVSLRR